MWGARIRLSVPDQTVSANAKEIGAVCKRLDPRSRVELGGRRVSRFGRPSTMFENRWPRPTPVCPGMLNTGEVLARRWHRVFRTSAVCVLRAPCDTRSVGDGRIRGAEAK